MSDYDWSKAITLCGYCGGEKGRKDHLIALKAENARLKEVVMIVRLCNAGRASLMDLEAALTKLDGGKS